MLEAIIQQYYLGTTLCGLSKEELHRTSPVAIDDNLDVGILQRNLPWLVSHLLNSGGGSGYLQPMTLSLIASRDDGDTMLRG